jgi:hypothetical protein
MWRLHREDKLEGPQKAMFGPRPAEELYDTENDPYEINNLADDPAHAADLQRMRDALDDWIDEVGDLGRIPESEMVRRWYPNGKQPRTAAPIMIPICEANPGREPAYESVTLTGRALLQLHSATQGASIAYTLDEGEGPRWLLYSAPVPLPKGESALRAKAIRVGYEESSETVLKVTVE